MNLEVVLPPRRTISAADVGMHKTSSIDHKRVRKSLSNLDVPVSSPGSDKRRVNPESLAVRLGPELVRELESLLQPGVDEMPSFAVRQAIQKRYNVDRRHIYDWFHSKGLRVTKEDKRATADNQRACSMRIQVSFIVCCFGGSGSVLCQPLHALHLRDHALSLSDGITNSAISTPNLLLTPQEQPGEFSNYNEAFPHGKQPIILDQHLNVLSATPSDTLNLLVNTRKHSTSTDKTNTCISTFLSSDSLPILSSATVTELFDLANNTSSTQVTSGVSLDRSGSDSSHFDIDMLAPLIDPTWLSQFERETYYRTLSDVLGPACGIQESVGTYKAFMLQQMQIYYERLLPSSTVSVPGQAKLSVSPAATRLSSKCASNLRSTPVSRHNYAQAVRPSPPSLPTLGTYFENKENTRADFSGRLPNSGRSHASTPISSPAHTRLLASKPDGDLSSLGNNHTSASAELDIRELLESPVLRSRSASLANEKQTLGEQSSPVPSDIAKLLDAQSLPVHGSASAPANSSLLDSRVAEPRVSHYYTQTNATPPSSDFSLRLKYAKATRGLENAVQSQGKTRTRGRLRRTRRAPPANDWLPYSRHR
ncbi:hypothetical protein A0H81_01261 [Grifola frondosa]|uniref:Uncharacterized protein n=1 Tax=Grifola frondosa TaxID=5627 RepID=A0A1C7MSI1_GRIFR|nr:hypothetical protein A0H81_01261 [Grifola frondosa]